MAVIVYSGLQTCLESQFREPRILRLKLSALPSSSSAPLKSPLMELGFKSFSWDPSSKEHVEDVITNKRNTTGSVSGSISGYSLGGFSSLHELSDTSQLLSTAEPIKKESTTIYVHPLLVQRSSMVLSEKSLQICTENLGNETGTVTTDLNCIESLEPKSDRKVETREETKPAARLAGAKKAINMQSFPPPLTTIRGSDTLRVRPHREEGRLVIEAVKVPSNVTCSFQAERSHGRLRLCLLESTPPVGDAEGDETEYEENKGNNIEELGKELENDINGQRQEMDDEEEDDKGGEYFGDGGESDMGEGREDLNGNKFIPGDDVGMEMYEMPSTCKKGDRENSDLLNREAIWV